MRALIVDNNDESREHIEQLLSSWGYLCACAASGEEAWRMFQDNPFNIVISEWTLPDIDGLELCQKIRDLQQSGEAYFIFCSAMADTSVALDGIDRGADEYIVKPFEPDELRMRLHLGRKRHSISKSMMAINRRLKRGLDQAAVTLKSMLPAKRNEKSLKIDWLFKPCTVIGGDLFNVFAIDEENLGIYAIDVSGHGVASALFAVTLGNMLVPRRTIDSHRKPGATRHYSWNHYPVQVATTMNERFPLEEHMYMYATMFYGVINRRDLTMRWIRAGHPPAILVRGDSSQLLERGDPPVGLFQGFEFKEHSIQLKEGDRLFLYSDGVTEMGGRKKDELYGIERLRSKVLSLASKPFEAIIGELENELVSYRGSDAYDDDISMLAIEIGRKK